jgi:uncharacterized membrane protein
MMTDGNARSPDAALFAAVLTPPRSLGQSGFVLLMTVVCAWSFGAGLWFYLLGAWPVTGFLGLDVLLLYCAFQANYRAAAAYEQVTVTASELTVRKVSQRGQTAEWKLNPVWARLDRQVHAEFGIERLFLVSHGRRLPIATFLGPREKEEFATALGAALATARRGPTRTVFAPR